MALTKNEALKVVDSDPRSFLTLPCEFLGDKDVVMTVASKPNYGVYVLYAHEELTKDKDVILLAVQNGLRLMHGIPYQDKDVVLAALVRHPEDAVFANEDLCPTKEEIEKAKRDYPKRLRRDYPVFGPDMC